MALADDLLWHQCLAVVETLVGQDDAPAATVSLWGLLHGSWALRQAGVLGGIKPADIDTYAVDTFIHGMTTRRGVQMNDCDI